jgi:hypothetical protein
LKFTFNITGRS